MSKGGKSSVNGLHVYYPFRGAISIWATVIFHFACTTLEKRGHKKGKITRNLGFYFGKRGKIYSKGNPARCDFPNVFF
jgi:hypothetical protein